MRSIRAAAAPTPVRRARKSATVSSVRRSGSWGSSPTVAVGGATVTDPASGSVSPARTRRSVDLPVPFGPTTPTRCPGASVQDTALRTGSGPNESDRARAVSVAMGTVESPGPRPTESNRFAKRHHRARPADVSRRATNARPHQRFRHAHATAGVSRNVTTGPAGRAAPRVSRGAVAGDLVDAEGAGGADVQGRQAAHQRDRHQLVAALAGEAAEPGALGAEDQGHGFVGEVHVPQRSIGRAVEAEDPDAGVLHRLAWRWAARRPPPSAGARSRRRPPS